MADQLTIARPYARAVFEQADDGHLLAEWHQVLQGLALIAADPQVQREVHNPQWMNAQWLQLFESILQPVLQPLNGVVAEQTGHLIALLVENHRIVILPEILKIYQQLLAQRESITRVEAVAAFELSAAQCQTLQQSLEKYFKTSVQLSATEDPSLIGGVVLRAGNWVMDGSVKGKLARLGVSLSSERGSL